MNNEIEIVGDGWLLFCRWCKATKPYIPTNCRICFTTQTMTEDTHPLPIATTKNTTNYTTNYTTQ